jgi:hypothetical protein
MGDIDLGELRNKAWWEVPLPSCPECGGDIIWFEAGYVPGTRKCMGKPIKITDDQHFPDGKRKSYNPNDGCGAMFSVSVDNGHVILHRLHVSDGVLK